MKRFLVIYRAARTFQKSYSTEETDSINTAWQKWLAGASQSILSCSPVTRSGILIEAGIAKNLIEDEQLINGYILLQANDLAEATEICELCPLYTAGKSFELRELPDA